MNVLLVLRAVYTVSALCNLHPDLHLHGGEEV